MEITSGFTGREQALVDLFARTFADSEGPQEGRLIGGLVHDLLTRTPPSDIRAFCVEQNGATVGAAIFTRLTYPEDRHIVFLLSPMAIAPGQQKQGIGQALLTHALDALRHEGIGIAITYGDPNYYAKVGFRPLPQDQARAPLPLSMPNGWIGQSLTQGPMPTLQGPSRCVCALNRRDIW